MLNVFELGLFSGPDSKAIYEVIAIAVAFTVPAVLTIIYGKTKMAKLRMAEAEKALR